jgi:riboflavin-specific deaminase-like protein
MHPSVPTVVPAAPFSTRDEAVDLAWRIALAAADRAEMLAGASHRTHFAWSPEAQLIRVPAGSPGAVIAWRPGIGWEPQIPADDPRHPFLDLYLPICSATTAKPMTVGHLGQSLDGFIAMQDGESQFVTGHENLLHLHRMRALSDAVIVGAGTVAADDPLLTTRNVPGPSPRRVIFDPGRRLHDGFRVFHEASAPTLYVCANTRLAPGETRVGRADVLPLAGPVGSHVSELLSALRERGCRRVFVEGGGVTVSTFLEANLLDRLHMAIAPLIIGDGRPAIRLQPRAALRDCHRPRYRVFRMGGDVLFDCDLGPRNGAGGDGQPDMPVVARII